MYVPDNNDAYEHYERQKERDQAFNDTISEISTIADDIMTQCIDYDTEDNADLCNRLQNISELIDKLNLLI